jgi:hypothetical protein
MPVSRTNLSFSAVALVVMAFRGGTFRLADKIKERTGGPLFDESSR